MNASYTCSVDKDVNDKSEVWYVNSSLQLKERS